MAGVTSPVTLSPDGKQLAFVRPSPSESNLFVANSDGTGERKIASRKLPAYFSFVGGPAWSPDGKTIACGAGAYSGSLSGDESSQCPPKAARKNGHASKLGIRISCSLVGRRQRFARRSRSGIDFYRYAVMVRVLSWRGSADA